MISITHFPKEETTVNGALPAILTALAGTHSLSFDFQKHFKRGNPRCIESDIGKMPIQPPMQSPLAFFPWSEQEISTRIAYPYT